MLALLAACALAYDRYDSFPLRTLFTVDGQLVLEGFPGPVFTGGRIDLRMKSGSVRTIRSLEDLRAHVRIHDVNEALNFVRLRGSQALGGVLSKYGLEYEVADKQHLDESILFGQKSVLEPLSHLRPGYFGLGTNVMLRQSNVAPAYVTQVGTRFRIVRTLLVLVGLQDRKLKEISEIVAPDGSYSFRVIAERTAPDGWAIGFGA